MTKSQLLQLLLRAGAWLALAFPALLYSSTGYEPSVIYLVPILLGLAVPLAPIRLNKFIKLGLALVFTVLLLVSGSQLPSTVAVLGFVLSEIAISSRTSVTFWSFLSAVAVTISVDILIAEADSLRPLWLIHTISFGLFLALGIAIRERRALIEETSRSLEVAENAHQIQLTEALAQERLKISRDLHNRIGHQLSVISLNTEAIKQADGSVERMKTSLELIGRSAREGLSEISSYLDSLRESESQKPNESLAEKFERFSSLGLDVQADEMELPETESIEKLEFVNEAVEELLMNAYKYSDGIVLYRQSFLSGALKITLENNSIKKDAPSGGGFGLKNIQDRAKELGVIFNHQQTADSKFEATLTINDWSQ